MVGKNKKNPGDPEDALEALVQKGIKALESENYNLAIKYIRQALKYAPFRQDLKDLLAQALEQKPLVAKPIPPLEEEEEETAEPPPKPRQKKGGVRIGVWLFFFCVVRLCSVAFFFFFSDAIQTFVSNIARPKEETHITPEDREAAALYKSAELLQDQRRFSEAILAIQKALEKKPSNTKQFKLKLAELYYEQGEEFDKKDDFKKAIESFEKALVYNPDSIDYLYGLAWASYLQGRKNQNRRLSYQAYFEKALKVLRKIIDTDPDNIRAKNTLARVYIARNETTKAAQMYRQIIRQAPDSAEADRARRALKSMGFRE